LDLVDSISYLDVSDGGSDEESDDDSSDRPKVRHDSSDSDIEQDEEEVAKLKQQSEQAYKDKLSKALGIDPTEHKKPNQKSEDSDIEVENSGTSSKRGLSPVKYTIAPNENALQKVNPNEEDDYLLKVDST
jgi:hypothetical protein